MSLEMAFSAEVQLTKVPTTVFQPGTAATGGPYAEEVFDDASGALLFAAAQGQAPSGIIGFSTFGSDFTPRQATLDAKPGHTYTFELVRNTALSLPSPGPVCGVPAPVAYSQLELARPEPGTTNVPTSIGSLILQGYPFDYYGSITVALDNPAGTAVEAGETPAPQPSPLPTPIATPLPGSPYFEVPLPTLAASTQYSVVVSRPDFDDTPPLCLVTTKQTAGTFTTGS